MDRCDSCSFVYADVAAPAIPTRLAAFGTQYAALLLPPGQSAAWFAILRTRPEEGVWSALEYACHVRDVFLVQRDRLYTALVEDTPTFTPMYRDQRVTLAHYNAQDPEEVVAQLATAARCQAFNALDSAQLNAAASIISSPLLIALGRSACDPRRNTTSEISRESPASVPWQDEHQRGAS
jgi:hypothetical protein